MLKKYIYRRIYQTHSELAISNALHNAGLTIRERFFDSTKEISESKQFLPIDTENILTIFKAFGQNTLPPGQGKYLHQATIAKYLGLYKGDAEGFNHEKRDSGTIRVTNLLLKVNQLLNDEGLTLANLPGAGYRIASNEEAVIEVKKAMMRSFKSIGSALRKSAQVVDKTQISPLEKARFEDIQRFTLKIYNEFIEEIGEQVDDDLHLSPDDEKEIQTESTETSLVKEVFDGPVIE
jgi:hypothetical protein